MLPVPFIVGVPRSGTTLLRLMLDSHPDLAIPAETYFITDFDRGTSVSADHFLFHLREASGWVDFNFKSSEFIASIHSIDPFNIPAGIRAFHTAYADTFGKSRWGHKSPDYLEFMELIESFLPEVHFIHVVRDGRDVSLSQSVASGHIVMDCVRVWAHRLFHLYDSAFKPPHFLEIRFDDLILNPAGTLQSICDFIELEFTPQMLYYHKYAKARMENIPPEKATWFDLTHYKPDTSRLQVWRREMSPEDNAIAVGIAGSLLDRFGYDKY